MRFPFQMKVASAVFAAALAVFLAALWLARHNIEELASASEWRQHTYQVLSEIRAVKLDVVDATSGARGFVITGDERFLQPYEAGTREVSARLKGVRRLTVDNPAQQRRVAAAEALTGTRLEQLARLIRLRREEGSDSIRVRGLVQAEKQVMDQLRVVIKQMEDEEERLLLVRDSAVHARTRRVDLTLLAAGFVGAALFIGVFLAFDREVRQRRAAEEEQHRQTNILRSVLESMTDGVAVADLEGRFLVFNAGAERILGIGAVEGGPSEWSSRYGAFQIDGRTPIPAKDLPLVRAFQGETVKDVEQVIRNPKLAGDVVITVNAAPLRDSAGGLVGGVAVFRDVTEKKEAEETLRAAKELAERARDEALAARAAAETANAELEAFSYSVSHDLRSPLRSLDGFSQALLEDYGDKLDAQGQDYLRRVRAGAQRMAHLIDDLLKLSRISRAELSVESLDLSALVVNVADDVRSREPDRAVTLRVQEGLRDEADACLLRVAFENLIANAWKFTRKKPEALIEVGGERNGGAVVYFVRDNGAGFDMTYADKLFGAFQRLHPSRDFEGTGIGLATAARVIRRHGGRIWAEAAPDQGATFFFTLGEQVEPGARTEA